MADDLRILLDESQLPSAWYNILPDLPEPAAPPLHPGTMKPISPDDLAPLFPMGLIEQEASMEPWIDIPGEVLDILRLWRPTPLHRARRLENALQTPAHIYYKNESVSPQEATSPTPPSHRHTTTRKRASSASPPRREPASGAAPCPSHVTSSISNAWSTWSGSATSRSPTASS